MNINLRANSINFIKPAAAGIAVTTGILAASSDSFELEDNFVKKLKKSASGKYEKEFLKILLSTEKIQELKKEIADGSLTEDEIFDAVKKLSKSTFKIALDRPEQYINYTQDGLYVSFLANCCTQDIEFSDKNYMVDLFDKNLIKMIKLLKFVDTDTLNQMMDKRSSAFISMLNSFDNLDEKHGNILKNLINCVQKGNASDKIKLCQIVSAFQQNKIDTKALDNIIETKKVNLETIDRILQLIILKNAKIEDLSRIDSEKLTFNKEFGYLLTNPNPINMRAFRWDRSELDEVIRAGVKGDFKDFIANENNDWGQANAETKKIFKENKLNYKAWFDGNFKEKTFDLNGKKMKISLWDRNPQEDLFIGNKTLCCSAITTGSNSAAMPMFLLNSAFNYIEVKNEKNETIAAARIYMNDSQGKINLLIDSIELRDIKQLSDKEKITIRDNLFEYIKDFAHNIANKPIDVYYLSEDSKIPMENFEGGFIKRNFLGKCQNPYVYSNFDSSSRWSNIQEEIWVHAFNLQN